MTRRLGIVLVLITAIIWSLDPIAGKAALLEASAYTIANMRLAIATIIFFTYIRIFKPTIFKELRRFSPLFIIGGVGLGINLCLYNLGLSLTTATATQLLIQMEVVFFIIWSFLIFKERASLTKVAGIILAVSGVFLVSWNGHPLSTLLGSGYFLGNILILIAAVLFSIYMGSQKALTGKYSSFAILLGICFTGTLATSWVLPSGDILNLSINTWLLLLYYGIVSNFLAFLLFAESLKHIEGSTAGVILVLSPVFTILWVGILQFFNISLFSGESFTIFLLAGGAILLLGLAMVVSSRGKV